MGAEHEQRLCGAEQPRDWPQTSKWCLRYEGHDGEHRWYQAWSPERVHCFIKLLHHTEAATEAAGDLCEGFSCEVPQEAEDVSSLLLVAHNLMRELDSAFRRRRDVVKEQVDLSHRLAELGE